MIVYAHRVQSLLKQGVVDLKMTMALSDANSPVSLSENRHIFEQTASILGIDCEVISDGDSARMIFRPK